MKCSMIMVLPITCDHGWTSTWPVLISPVFRLLGLMAVFDSNTRHGWPLGLLIDWKDVNRITRWPSKHVH